MRVRICSSSSACNAANAAEISSGVRPRARRPPRAWVARAPGLVERGRVRARVRSVENHHLPGIAVRLEKCSEVLLRASGLRENERPAVCADGGHLVETDLKCLEE